MVEYYLQKREAFDIDGAFDPTNPISVDRMILGLLAEIDLKLYTPSQMEEIMDAMVEVHTEHGESIRNRLGFTMPTILDVPNPETYYVGTMDQNLKYWEAVIYNSIYVANVYRAIAST